MSAEIPKLITSDIDGVLAFKEIFNRAAVDGMQSAQERGHSTTVATGRNLKRMKEMMGADYDRLISREYMGKTNLLIVDGGGTVVKVDGEAYHAFPIERHLKSSINDALRKAEINFIAFDPDPYKPGNPEVWVDPRFEDLHLLRKFREVYTFVSGDFNAFARRFEQTNPSSLAIGLRSGTAFELELPDCVNRSANRGIFDLSMSDKGMGLEVMKNYFDKSDLSFLVYIGDGWQIHEENGVTVRENDLPALTKPDLEMRIVVSKQPVTGIPSPYVTVETPEELGQYLSEQL